MEPDDGGLLQRAIDAAVGRVLVFCSFGVAPRVSRPFYLGTFATASGLGCGAASMLAGQLAVLPRPLPERRQGGGLGGKGLDGEGPIVNADSVSGLDRD